MTTEPDRRPLLRIPEAAAYLDATERQIANWVKNGKLPHYNISRDLRFSEADLLDFIEAWRVPAKVTLTDRRKGHQSEQTP